ncbi:MAG: ribonuclease H-like domain-containing protein [Lachnospiraceae bacterium]|nr:ribonuclease H-like domain-containing protein [Lachnospiraceae bacterium]
MKEITRSLENQISSYDLALIGAPEDLLFVDIETTGFAARSSCLYLIGCIIFEEGRPVLKQFFAQAPADEEKVLSAFLAICRQKKVLVHYNGNNFDIPYLRQKCTYFGYKEPFSEMQGVDIYKRIAPYKTLLHLENLKQKTIEAFLSISRKDQNSGGDLINVYRAYVGQYALMLKTGNETAIEGEEDLLLHNAEDCIGMLKMLPMLSYADLLLQPMKITRISAKKITRGDGSIYHTLVIKMRFTSALPLPLEVTKKGCRLTVTEKEGVLEVLQYAGELKYFYGNYKEYYYLPEEDVALHKSVASFVAPQHRQQATARNCYTRKEGLFLPQWDLLFEPVFKKSYEDPFFYFELTEERKKKPEDFKTYALHIIDYLIHDKK